jgi:predicted nucleic acid-binding protein
MGDCIVDASVGIKLFIEESDSDVVDALFDELLANPPSRFFVPDLFFVECANILWKYVRGYGYSADEARQDVTNLLALPLRVVGTVALLTPALELAPQYEVTAYDASYAALAKQLDLPLITADVPLARKLAGSGIVVRNLAEIGADS